jgi:hypothetical protein
MSAADARATTRASVRIAMWGTLVYAAARFTGAYLAQYAAAAAIIQTVIAEWGAGRLGIAWSDPLAKMPTTKDVALRGLRGAGMGLSAAIVVGGIVVAGKAAHLAPNVPAPVAGLVGLVIPAFLAARDELLLRGLVLRVLPFGALPWVRLAACGLAEVASTYGDGANAPAVLASAFAAGVAYGALWLRDRGAWLAWGAHAAFAWASTSLATGALLDVRPTTTATIGENWVTTAAAIIVAALAIATTRKRW